MIIQDKKGKELDEEMAEKGESSMVSEAFTDSSVAASSTNDTGDKEGAIKSGKRKASIKF